MTFENSLTVPGIGGGLKHSFEDVKIKKSVKKTFFKILAVLTISTLLFLSFPVLAIEIKITNPLIYESFDDLVKGIIEFLIMLATPLASLMIVIGAFYLVTSAGNPQQIATAKAIILYTLIGYGIIWLSYGLITVIKQILGVPSP